MKRNSLLALAGALLFAGAAISQVVVVPQVTSIGSADLFQDVVNGVPQSPSYYAPASLLGNYSATLNGNNPENALIGGDATTNLFQRGTTGASVTTTTTYGGPDRWAYWSGTSTAMTVSQDTTAADLPSGYKAAFKMARTSGQTGVVQVCMEQVVETVNSLQFAGQTAEVDFLLVTGSNFSGSGVTVWVSSGTGTDEGSAKLAFGINAGGGGGTGWTGQVNKSGTYTVAASQGPVRVTFAAPVAAAATEVGVAICFTPTGTASTNDYVALSGIQLTRNNALTAAAGTAGVVLPANDGRAKAFARRSQALESVLQQRYYYQLTESATIWPIAPCAAIDTTHTNCFVPFPVTMRSAPALSFANGFATPTSTTQATLGACTTLAAATTVASTVGSVTGILVNCTATTIPAAGTASFLYSNNSTGAIKASAEL